MTLSLVLYACNGGSSRGTSGQEKIQLFDLSILPKGSYSYSIKKKRSGSDQSNRNNNSHPFSHRLTYYSPVQFNGKKYFARTQFTLCSTAKEEDACQKNPTNYSIRMKLHQATSTNFKKAYGFSNNIYKKDSEKFSLPIAFNKTGSIKGSFVNIDNGAKVNIKFTTTFDSLQTKNFQKKSYEYTILKTIFSEVGKKEKVEYQWHLENLGVIGQSKTASELPTVNTDADDDGVTLYVYNAQLKKAYGTKPAWLDTMKLGDKTLANAAPDIIKKAIDSACLRYVPDGSQEITVGGNGYKVKSTRAEVHGNHMNIKFTPSSDDHDSQPGTLKIEFDLSGYKGSTDFRQAVQKTGSAGLTIQSAHIRASTTNGWFEGNQDVTLTWESNATDDTFTVKGLSSVPLKNHPQPPQLQQPSQLLISFGDLKTQLTTNYGDNHNPGGATR